MHFSRSTSPMPFRLIGAFAGVSLSLLLASCGGGDKTSDTPASDSASTTTTTTTGTTAGGTSDSTASTSGATSDSTAASTSGATSDSTKTSTSSDTTTTTSTSSDSSGGSGTAPAGWKPFTSEEGKFSASFPESPQTTTKKAGNRDMHIVAAQTNNGGNVYMVMFMGLGSTPDKSTIESSLERACKGVEAKGKLVSNKPTTFEGQTAREVVVEMDTGGKPAVCNDMVFISKDQLYQVMTIIDKASEETANAKKFQDAFKLTDKS